MTISGFDNMTFKEKNLLSHQKMNMICDFEMVPADIIKIEIPINNNKIALRPTRTIKVIFLSLFLRGFLLSSKIIMLSCTLIRANALLRNSAWKMISGSSIVNGLRCARRLRPGSCTVINFWSHANLYRYYACTPESLYHDGKNRAMLHSLRLLKTCC